MKAIILILSLLCGLFSAYAQQGAPTIQLATNFTDQAIDISIYWVSEKLDGIRGYWTGTELLTRSGKIIITPDGFTNNWPNVAMDGELWLARDSFEKTLSCVLKQTIVDNCWQKLHFMIFDLPNNPTTFNKRIVAMQQIIQQTNNNHLKMISQQQLTDLPSLYVLLKEVTSSKGEGLMLHKGNAFYQAGRSSDLLKVKERHDDEAMVLEHLLGNGKYQGMLGAIKVKNSEGVIFNIGTGFSDLERKNPPPIGSVITYQYLAKTKNNVPRFASFLRIKQKI